LKRVFALIVVVLGLVLSATPLLAATSYPLRPGDPAIEDALDYLALQQAPDGGIGSYADSAWACIAIATAGGDPAEWDNGGPSLVDYLAAGHSDVSGEFNMGTFLARMVLAAVAAGEDPGAFGFWSGTNAGVSITNGDYLGALLTLHDGDQFLQDLTGDPDSARTLNDDFWALRAVVASGAAAGSTVVQSTADFIAAQQEADGGWTWSTPAHSWYTPDSSDTDNTAAAIVALALAGRSSSQTVRDGLAFLHDDQADSGGFTNPWSGVNVQSSVWAVDAIGAAREDPSGALWTPEGASAVDYVLSSQEANGSFGGAVRATSDSVVALLGQYYRPAPRSVGGEAFAPGRTAVLLLPVLAGAGALLLATALVLKRKTLGATSRHSC
jgi:hypothetical protein